MIKQINNDIAEIFVSIQGEGKYAGLPTLFIRFNKCNIKCTYCDTNFNKSISDDVNIRKLIKSYFEHYPIKQICFTGGEPLLFKDDILCILTYIHDRLNDIIIKIETNGLIDIEQFFSFKKIYYTITIKMDKLDKYEHLTLIHNTYLDLKFMIDPYSKSFYMDLHKIYEFIKYKHIHPIIPFYISPINKSNNPEDILETYKKLIRQLYKSKDNLLFKLNNYRGNILQYHKLLGFQ